MRISEFCGLTIKDVDLKNKKIRIDHQLQKTGKGNNYYIVSTKTELGNRIIPMDKNVYECFDRIIRNRPAPQIEPLLRDDNGKVYSGFLLLTKDGLPRVRYYWGKKFNMRLRSIIVYIKFKCPK